MDRMPDTVVPEPVSPGARSLIDDGFVAGDPALPTMLGLRKEPRARALRLAVGTAPIPVDTLSDRQSERTGA